MRRLTFVTGNKGKVAELQQALGAAWHVVPDARGYDEVQADTLAEVCQAGAGQLLAQGLQPPFVLEDSGLFITELKGFPGVYSRYVHETLGCPGILRLLEGFAPGRRGAHFTTCLHYVDAQGGHVQFEGECQGSIASQAAGVEGFGFDPVFVPAGQPAGPGAGRTFGQMAMDEKALYSHRAKAVRLLGEHLSKAAKT